MEFRVLGPLEVETDHGLVALGGTRQRATLALLLLHTNQVVPTSQLLDALWPGGRPPVTARKILQNAVWRLRRALTQGPDGAPAPQLLTRAPGYLLQAPDDRVDLLRFQQLVARGRTALADERIRDACLVLREALGLWRGPALADLTEQDTVWPEVTALEKQRLDIMEDRFEAELACGGHQSVLGELEAFVESEPLRERASQQLMLALYRCGRQADALGVYGRVRAALVEGLGVEPGHQMQRLQQSILSQDPGLDLKGAGTALIGVPQADGSAEPVPATREPQAPLEANGVDDADGTDDAVEWFPSGDPHAQAHQPSSVLMLRFTLGPEFDDLPPEDIDQVLDTCGWLAREEIEKSGGRVGAAIGSVLLGLFGEDDDLPDSAERAVRAGCAVRDCLSIPAGPLAPPVPAIRGLDVHAAVATGTAVVCHWPGAGAGRAQPWIGGDLVDLCEEMLAQAPPGEVHVCDETRSRTESGITYHRVCDSSERWQVRTIDTTPEAGEYSSALADRRDAELELMSGLFRRVMLRSTPHFITVLGDSGLGKTRLLMEFRRRIADNFPESVRVLTGTIADVRDALAVPAEMLATYCGIGPKDTDGTALDKLAATLRELPGADHDDASVRLLGSLVTRTVREPRPVLAAWRSFMVKVVRTHPLILVWDDVDRADELLLETVEQLCADCDDAPLLNVVGAHARLLNRRPSWSGGLPHSMTLRLTPVAGDALDHLLQSLFRPNGTAA